MRILILLALLLASMPAWGQSKAEVTRQSQAVEERWGLLSGRDDLRRWAPEAYETAREAAERVIRSHWSVDLEERAHRNYRAERLMDALEATARGGVLAAQVTQLETRRDQLQVLLDAQEAARAEELAMAEERKRVAEEERMLADAISRESLEQQRKAEEEKRLAETRMELAREERLRARQLQIQAEQEARLAEASRKAAELAAELERRNAEIAKLEAAVASREAAEAKSRAAALEALLSDTQSVLALEQSRRGAVFVLGDVLFETNGDQLLPGAHAQLDELTTLLAAHPQIIAQIEGHTDSTGDAGYNLDLSQRRAEAVWRYLTSSGISPERLLYTGLGEAFPVATNDTPEGRQQNRRVEVIMNSAQPEG